MFMRKAKPVAIGGLAAFINASSEQWLLIFISLSENFKHCFLHIPPPLPCHPLLAVLLSVEHSLLDLEGKGNKSREALFSDLSVIKKSTKAGEPCK